MQALAEGSAARTMLAETEAERDDVRHKLEEVSTELSGIEDRHRAREDAMKGQVRDECSSSDAFVHCIVSFLQFAYCIVSSYVCNLTTISLPPRAENRLPVCDTTLRRASNRRRNLRKRERSTRRPPRSKRMLCSPG